MRLRVTTRENNLCWVGFLCLFGFLYLICCLLFVLVSWLNFNLCFQEKINWLYHVLWMKKKKRNETKKFDKNYVLASRKTFAFVCSHWMEFGFAQEFWFWRFFLSNFNFLFNRLLKVCFCKWSAVFFKLKNKMSCFKHYESIHEILYHKPLNAGYFRWSTVTGTYRVV